VLVVPLCCRGGFRERLFERSDIEVEGRDGVPVQRICVGREEVLNCGKRLAQLVEQLAQVIASLGLGGVGPEEEGQMLTLLRNIAMQHEIGEQGLQARGIEAGYLLVIIEQTEIAKQAEVKGWHGHDGLPFSSSGSSDGRVVSSENMDMASRKSSKPSPGNTSDHLQLATKSSMLLLYHIILFCTTTLLSNHALEFLNIDLFYFPFRTGTNAMHKLNEEINEAIGNLLVPLPAERC
jgi:hypothetical protein